MAHKTTLKELSKLLNVSISTVSKALNDSPEISQHTIERVKELATLNQYIPNAQARNLKSKRTETIGVILPSLTNPQYTSILEGIESKAKVLGYHIILCLSHNSLKTEAERIRSLLRGHVDGFIVYPAYQPHETYKTDHLNRIINFRCPLVLLKNIPRKINCEKVLLTESLLMELTIQRLLDKGCLKLCFLYNSSKNRNCDQLQYYTILDNIKRKGHSLKMEENEFAFEKVTDLVMSEKIDGLICHDYSTMQTVKNYIAHSTNQNLKSLQVVSLESKLKTGTQNQLFKAKLQGEFAIETLIKKIKKSEL